MNAQILDQLNAIIQARKQTAPDTSYTAELLETGRAACARKLGEEAVELITAALAESDQRIIEESADLLYHWLVLLAACDIPPEQIYRALTARMPEQQK